MNNQFQTALVLSRVLNTGVIMSIEKSERELNALERTLKDLSGKNFISLFNSFTGAVHAALWGRGIVESDEATLEQASEQEQKFINWLRIKLIINTSGAAYHVLKINMQNIGDSKALFTKASQTNSVVVVDFTDLGFGPCAALLCTDEDIWKRAERLKIFGAYDLRTMWTQEESEMEIRPMAQFNYRLSPLVATCVKLTLAGSLT